MSKLKQFISRADYFGKSVELIFDSEPKLKTLFGGILSIMMYLCCFSFSFSIVFELIFRLNPSTNISTQTQDSSPLLNITEHQMTFAFFILTNQYENLNDPSYITVSAYQYKMNRTDSELSNSNIPLELISCTNYKSYFDDKGFGDNFTANGLDSAYCFNWNATDSDVIIGGNFIQDYFSNLYISIKKCDNLTSQVPCKSEVEIASKIQQGYFELYYIDWNVDPNNYKAPFSQFFSNFFVLLDPVAMKMVDLFYKQSIINSNIGLLYDDYENSTKIVFDYYREQLDTQNKNPEILQLYINSSKYITIYSRVYMKFQDFFANIGGIIQAFLVVGYALTYYFNDYYMNEHMMNCLFSFKKNEDLEKSISHIDKEIGKDKNLFRYYNSVNIIRRSKILAEPIQLANNNFIEKSIINSKRKTEEDELSKKEDFEKEQKLSRELEAKIKEFNNSLSSNFKMSFSNQVYKILNENLGCKFKRRPIVIYNAAYKKMLSYLDFLKIINSIKEFRQFKKIILNKTQHKLFKFHSKYVINENNLNDEGDKANGETKYIDIYHLYEKSKEKAKDNKVYERLLENFDTSLKVIFSKIAETDENH
jgi:hypothetical protein